MEDTATIQLTTKTLSIDRRPFSALLLLAGLLLCLGSAFGLTKALCITRGCELYQGYGFLGLSLHIWGAVAFGTGLILLIYGMRLFRPFLYLCLWAEIVLLAVQVVYLPCSECLLVGLVWGLLALLEIRERIPVKIWSVVFLFALVLMGKDLVHPWPVYGQSGSVMKVYFSPSCPGCQKEIEKLLDAGEVNLSQVAFMPVALKAADYKRVETFQAVLDQTLDLDRAFQASWSPRVHASVGWQKWLTVRLGMLRNRMVLARMGVNKIPLVVSGAVAVSSGSRSSKTDEGCSFESGDHCADGVPSSTAEVDRSRLELQPESPDVYRF